MITGNFLGKIINHEDHPLLERSIATITLIISVMIFLNHSINNGFIEILISIFIGLFIADFISYLFHYMADTYKFPNNPILAKIASDFIDHHDDPAQVVFNGTLRSGTMLVCVFGSIPTLIIIFILIYLFDIDSIMWLVGSVAVIALTLVPTIHAFAHSRNSKNLILGILQWSGVIINNKKHSSHHSGDQRFCHNWALVNGWSNRILDPFFAHPANK
jgi:hypothetical protein